MRIIEEIDLPESLTIAIQQAGSRKLVLIEGENDQTVFESSYKKDLSRLHFHNCDGVTHVENYVELLKKKAQTKRFFGIRDRDFLDDKQVEESYQSDSQLFVLRWYCIENYLLDNELIFNELSIKHTKSKRQQLGCDTKENVIKYFTELRRILSAITAADWLIAEYNKEKVRRNEESNDTERVEYFSTGFNVDREIIIEKLSQKINLSEKETNKILDQKESTLSQFDTIHVKYNGKRLLHWICKNFDFKDSEYFKRLLISRFPTKEVNRNFKEIFEERILQAETY